MATFYHPLLLKYATVIVDLFDKVMQKMASKVKAGSPLKRTGGYFGNPINVLLLTQWIKGVRCSSNENLFLTTEDENESYAIQSGGEILPWNLHFCTRKSRCRASCPQQSRHLIGIAVQKLDQAASFNLRQPGAIKEEKWCGQRCDKSIQTERDQTSDRPNLFGNNAKAKVAYFEKLS